MTTNKIPDEGMMGKSLTTNGAYFVMLAPALNIRRPLVENGDQNIRYFGSWDDADEAGREHPMAAKLGYQILHVGDYE